jgi:hypothetical protein
MKKLHLAVSKDNLRPQLQNIQVKDGHVFATNCHILVKFPINEVFGENSPITKDDHFYINGKEWGKFKFYNAMYFTFENDILCAKDKKGNNLGMIKVIKENELSRPFYDCNVVIPNETKETVQLCQISFNHELYYNLIEVFNFDTPLFNMNFYGQTSTILVKSNIETDTRGLGVIMPIQINFKEDEKN